MIYCKHTDNCNPVSTGNATSATDIPEFVPVATKTHIGIIYRQTSLSGYLCLLFLSFVLAVPAVNAQESILLKAMHSELDRSMAKLKTAGAAPLYFLSYSVYDTRTLNISSDYGAVGSTGDIDHYRHLDIDLRVGDKHLDNTHKLRGAAMMLSFTNPYPANATMLPLIDDQPAIRNALWLRTDAAFKSAQEKYGKVVANKDVLAQEDDTSDDFSDAPSHISLTTATDFSINRAAWEARLRRLSALYKQYPAVQDSNLHFTAQQTKRYYVSSEGTEIEDVHPEYRIFATVSTVADDGMKIWLYDGFEGPSVTDIPNDSSLEAMIRKLCQDLTALRQAPKAEPYVGPAILRNKAAGVFFHETFGHRVEGQRQKDEDEGRTFAKKINEQVMPAFISVVDDPTRKKFANKSLNGYYLYDDEGVAAQKVVLVDKGVLRNFLMSRSPIKSAAKSNGHGRCAPGHAPVGRQGNLIVDSSKRVPYTKLRAMLIEEIKKEGKPYGLIFDQIAGGFTMTQSFLPQSFKLLPLRVWRVYADGKPDELLRGVDIVGTPLESLSKIQCAGDDDDTFNGTCGAESGYVPVSATAPSLLVEAIEVELQKKAQDKPPLLPAPLFDRQAGEKQ